jgi:hypothetical protein
MAGWFSSCLESKLEHPSYTSRPLKSLLVLRRCPSPQEQLAAGPQGVYTHLQEVGELGVAVGHVAALAVEGRKHVPQRAQALIDAAGLLLAQVLRQGAVQPLAVWQEGRRKRRSSSSSQ